MSKILILTAGFGEGHNAAARNIAAAADSLGGPGTACIADLFALTSPRIDRWSRRAYLAAINRTPRLWSRFYLWIDRSRLLPRHLWLFREQTRFLAILLLREQPSVVCSTYPTYAFLLNQPEFHSVSHYSVVTDSITINSLWTRPACSGWFVPNSDTAAVLRERGIPPDKIHDLGFPVSSFFLENAGRLSPPNLAAGEAPRVLYIVHSGLSQAEPTARLLLAEPGWQVTIAVGRDERLRRRLAPLASARTPPAAVLGWTNEVPRLLMTHNVVISKAGGATTQEAIAARCPMLINQIVPGQEEGNFELLRRRGIGTLAESPESVIAALRKAFADRGSTWMRWRDALSPISRPNACLAIAARLLESSPVLL